MTSACERCSELEATIEDMECSEFRNDEGRALELDAVLEFIRQRSVDAFRVSNDGVSAALDELHEQLKREEHRK